MKALKLASAITTPYAVVGLSASKGKIKIESGAIALNEKALVEILNNLGATGKSDEIIKVPLEMLPIKLPENINLDNSAKVYMLNAYYDFKNSSQFTPFVGTGIGMADIQNAKDNELALSASLGGKYNFDKNIYLGLKGAFTRVNGPTDKIGIEYEDIDLWSAHALLGYEF